MAEYIEREAAYEKCGWYNTVNGKSVCAVRKDELAAIPAADVVDAPQWISVEDRLPTTFVSVLGYMTDAGEFPAVRECYCIGDNEFYFPALFERHPVSHWMPMPDAPKERRGD